MYVCTVTRTERIGRFLVRDNASPITSASRPQQYPHHYRPLNDYLLIESCFLSFMPRGYIYSHHETETKKPLNDVEKGQTIELVC
jgi:hypothetical protein